MEQREKSAQTRGERVREMRKKRHLTQAKLAEQAGCSLESISKVERGERNLTEKMAGKLENVLGVQKEYLLCYSDSPTITDRVLFELAGEKVALDMQKLALSLLAELSGYTLEIPDVEEQGLITLQEYSELKMEWCKIWKNGELLASCTQRRFELLALDCQELVEQRIKSYIREVSGNG